MILMLADVESFTNIQIALNCNRSYITRWKRRFESIGPDGLYSQHTGRAPWPEAIKLEVKILARTQRKPSNDPEFESKAADIIGLYMNPPQHAAVFCVDEKTAIQALYRLDPVLLC